MTGPDRLYGLDGDEYLKDDPDQVLEEWLDYHDPDDLEPGGMVALPVIIEFDTHPPRYHFPTVDRLLDWVVEWAAEHGETDEWWADQHADAVTDPGVHAVADALLDLIAERVQYRMASTELRRMPVSLTTDREWTIDGEPTGRRLEDRQPDPVSAADRVRRVRMADGEVQR